MDEPKQTSAYRPSKTRSSKNLQSRNFGQLLSCFVLARRQYPPAVFIYLALYVTIVGFVPVSAEYSLQLMRYSLAVNVVTS